VSEVIVGQAYVKKDERWIWWLVYLFLVFVSLVNFIYKFVFDLVL
jgi:hypothetical protein